MPGTSWLELVLEVGGGDPVTPFGEYPVRHRPLVRFEIASPRVLPVHGEVRARARLAPRPRAYSARGDRDPAPPGEAATAPLRPRLAERPPPPRAALAPRPHRDRRARCRLGLPALRRRRLHRAALGVARCSR